MGKGNRPDITLFLITLALVAFGLIFVFSAGFVEGLYRYHDPYYYFKRELIGLTLGTIAFIAGYLIDPELWKRYATPLLGLGFVLLLAVFVPGLSKAGGGAKRWIRIGSFGIQASEVFRVFLIFYLAKILSKKTKENQLKIFIGAVGVLLAASGLIILEPDLGMALIVFFNGMVMIFISAFPLSYILTLLLTSLPVLWAVILKVGYRRKRILAYLNPWEDPAGKGYHIIQSLVALGSGGLFGAGLGASKQKLGYLPASHTDFIFAIIGEELGFVGTLTLVILYAIFAYRGFRICLRSGDPYLSLLAFGLTWNIVFQAFINMAVVAGILPTTGLTLPFISYGNSSLLMCLFSAGILLRISREALP